MQAITLVLILAFYITCQFAQETVDRYGLGKPERTELTDTYRSSSELCLDAPDSCPQRHPRLQKPDR